VHVFLLDSGLCTINVIGSYDKEGEVVLGVGGSRGIALLFSNLDMRWNLSGQFYTPAA
jgi:hypothetical protein